MSKIYCQICGEENDSTNMQCTCCGNFLDIKEKKVTSEVNKNTIKHCSVCGEILSDIAVFCKSCGTKVLEERNIINESRVGWSSLVNDPSFKRYNRNEVLWKLIFGSVLTVVAFFGFTIFGPKNDMPEDEALLVGSVIGGMFFLIMTGSIIRSFRKKPFSGVIVDKKQCTRTKSYRDSEGVSRRQNMRNLLSIIRMIELEKLEYLPKRMILLLNMIILK